jgi:hypothetical protein
MESIGNTVVLNFQTCLCDSHIFLQHTGICYVCVPVNIYLFSYDLSDGTSMSQKGDYAGKEAVSPNRSNLPGDPEENLKYGSVLCHKPEGRGFESR